MFAGFRRQRKRQNTESASKNYSTLENRRLLVFAPLPEMTTDVAAFAENVSDAIVRIDQDRLIVRTTGDQNRVDIHLEYGYLQVNRDDYFAQALEIDASQYSQILLLSNGEDAVRVSGIDLQAQMRPDRLWVSTDSVGQYRGEPSSMEIHGSDYEHLEVNDSHNRDVGPFIHTSNNRIRMYGNDGVDHLDMSSKSNFAIATGAMMQGEGYYFSSNAFGDLYVSGGGGGDFATLVGTRGFTEDAFFFNESANGSDSYFGADNYSRITNDLWDGRFVDFETQRVDLLSGDDTSVVRDNLRDASWYRVDADDLVGAFRRMINVETIQIDGIQTATDSLYRPEPGNGTLIEGTNEYEYSGQFAESDSEVEFGPMSKEIIPDFFNMKFSSFEQLLD